MERESPVRLVQAAVTGSATTPHKAPPVVPVNSVSGVLVSTHWLCD